MRCSDAWLHEGPGNSPSGAGHGQPALLLSQRVPRAALGREFRRSAARRKCAHATLGPLDQPRATACCPFGLVFRPAVSRVGRRRFLPGRTCRSIFPPGFSIEVALDIPAERATAVRSTLRAASAGRGRRANAGWCADRAGRRNDAASSRYQRSFAGPQCAGCIGSGVQSNPGREVLVDVHHQPGSREIIDLRPKLPLRFLPAGLGKHSAN